MADYDERTALLVVDVQNDFADPNGSLAVSAASEILEVVNREVGRAVERGGTVVYTQDWHPPDTPHFEKDGGPWPLHCVRDTWGAEFHPDLRVEGHVVRKGTGGEDGYSGFTLRDPETGKESSTGLEDLLRSKGVERLVVVGLTTDYCVKETVLDATAKGFETTVLRDGIRAVDVEPGDGAAAEQEMEKAGARFE